MKEMVKSFNPAGERVLVCMKETEKVTDGGIHIPDSAQRISVEGTVIAVGPQAEQVKHGEKVLVPRYAGLEIDLGDELEYKLFLESEIIGVVEEE